MALPCTPLAALVSVCLIIGPNAGAEGTVAVAGDAWTDHATQTLPGVASVCP